LCTLVDQDVHHFLFISDEHIIKQIKTSMYINSLKKWKEISLIYEHTAINPTSKNIL